MVINYRMCGHAVRIKSRVVCLETTHVKSLQTSDIWGVAAPELCGLTTSGGATQRTGIIPEDRCYNRRDSLSRARL